MKLRKLNIVLFIALIVIISATWMLRRDFTERNDEFLPGMVESVPFDAFAPNPNFTDGKTLQSPLHGTLSRTAMSIHYTATPDDALRAGKELINPLKDGQPADVERGQKVFASFCQPCHGIGSKGDGLLVQHGFPPPPSLLTPKALSMNDGQMFHIVTFGQGNMPSLASQIAPLDRWRAVLYVRTLQRQAATLSQAPTP